MKYLVNTGTDPHRNMAFDDYVLERLPLQEPLFYLWQNTPAVIIGRNQSAQAEVNLPYLDAHGIVLARRVTGGGAVFHDLGNLNYSFAGPISAMEGAEGWMAQTLRQLGLPVERSGRNDLLVDGRKCSGYAKRLHKDRLMIHGTLMWDVDLVQLTSALAVPGSKLQAAGIASVRSRVANLKPFLPQFPSLDAFRAALQDQLAAGDPEIVLSAAQEAEIDRLSDEKFRTWDWIIGQSPAADFQACRKFVCGTVEAHFTLRHGVFSQLRFTGDFLGRLPAEDLAQQLIGQRPEALLELPVGAYFDGLDGPALLALFR